MHDTNLPLYAFNLPMYAFIYAFKVFRIQHGHQLCRLQVACCCTNRPLSTTYIHWCLHAVKSRLMFALTAQLLVPLNLSQLLSHTSDLWSDSLGAAPATTSSHPYTSNQSMLAQHTALPCVPQSQSPGGSQEEERDDMTGIAHYQLKLKTLSVAGCSECHVSSG